MTAVIHRFSVPIAVFAVALVNATAETPVEQFEREVRPILADNCFKCHGPDKQKGGLRLDQRAAMMEGGDSGEPAVVPGKSGASPLISRVTSKDPDEMMPPKGDRLAPAQIAAIKLWIDHGAHLPDSGKPVEETATDVAPGMIITDEDRAFWSFRPPNRSTPATAAWAQPPIDCFILARLHERGLAPSPEAPPAVFIRRLTFDLTGLPPTPEEVDTFVKGESRKQKAEVESLVDRLLASPRFGERLASMWLPLARYAEDQAHQVGDDTKFFYPNAWRYRAWVIDAFNRDLPYDQFLKFQLAADHLPEARPGDLAALGFLGLGPKYYDRDRVSVMADEWEDRVDTMTRTMLGLTVACARCHDHKFDPISTRDYYALAGVFASTRLVNKTPDGQVEKEAKAENVSPAVLHVIEDGKVRNLNVFLRGNPERKGAVVDRRFLEVLAPAPTAVFTDGSGRRELAEAIANRNNPLVARVFVNRVWAHFFGRPLVATPSNFGHSGARPTHPELLDDLAVRFMDNGWSVKALVREIVLSATYRQSTANDTGKAMRDADNELFWRMNRRRLSVEQWRDAVLDVSGQLTEAPGAPSQEIDDRRNVRRTVYARISRLKLGDFLMQFDYPDANVHAEKRATTTTPIQKLFMLNSPFIERSATALAQRVQGGAEDDESRIGLVYRLLFNREPDDTERALAMAFLNKGSVSDQSRWEQYSQLLLASNELLYVD